jgi:hypothetical protein
VFWKTDGDDFFLLNLINFDLGRIFRADALKSGQLNDDNS